MPGQASEIMSAGITASDTYLVFCLLLLWQEMMDEHTRQYVFSDKKNYFKVFR